MALARAGHTVLAGMRRTADRNAPAVAALQESADLAVGAVLDRYGRLDVVVHNAGHMVLGPAEAFTAEDLAAVYDVNVLGTQRVSRAALPHLRAQGSGLLLWVGSSSTRRRRDRHRRPRRFHLGHQPLRQRGQPIGRDTGEGVRGAVRRTPRRPDRPPHPSDPTSTDARSVADEIVRIVDLSAGRRPFRSHVDPGKDGSEVVSIVADRVRSEFYHRVGIADLLSSTASL